MSTILKALRRLEREKAQADRPLREEVVRPGLGGRGDGRPPRRWPILLGGVGAGVLAGLAVLFLVFSRGERAEQVAPEAAAQSGVAPSPQPAAPPRAAPAQPIPPAERPARRRVVAQAPAPEPIEDVAVVDRGSAEPRLVAEVAPAASPEAQGPKPGSLRPMPRHTAHALPAPAPTPAETPAVAPEPEPRAERVAAPVEPVRESEPASGPRRSTSAPRTTARAPSAPEPPPEAAPPKPQPTKAASAPSARLPGLRVDSTTWHPLAERRIAVIELPDGGTQTVHEGDRVAGAVVKRIEPSGVLFEQDGREVRRRIGAGS